MALHRVQSDPDAGGRHVSQSPSLTNTRNGFTLVELLVAMTIFVILATITISAFRGNDDDRVKNSTATVRSALEGARSRAAKAGQVRGLRLLADPNQPRIATSVVFVGAPAYEEGTLTVSNVTVASAGNPPMFLIHKTDSTTSAWVSSLLANGLLANAGNGSVVSRIEIPTSSGNWYPVKSFDSDSQATVFGFYQPSIFNASSVVWLANPLDPTVTTPVAATRSLNINYRLELLPTVLDGATPILLAQGTGIDLDGSTIPNSWIDKSASPPVPYSTTMDILFSPSGDVVGTARSAGILHLHVASLSDLLSFQTLYTRSGPGYGNQLARDPEKLDKLVSLFAQTGAIVISDVKSPGNTNPAYNDEPMTNSDAPYYYAIHGKEAK